MFSDPDPMNTPSLPETAILATRDVVAYMRGRLMMMEECVLAMDDFGAPVLDAIIASGANAMSEDKLVAFSPVTENPMDRQLIQESFSALYAIVLQQMVSNNLIREGEVDFIFDRWLGDDMVIRRVTFDL